MAASSASLPSPIFWATWPRVKKRDSPTKNRPFGQRLCSALRAVFCCVFNRHRSNSPSGGQSGVAPHALRDAAGDVSLNATELFLDNGLLQFIKYGISGCIATAIHITIFHLVAWKGFYALQAEDWFVKIFDLPILELDDVTRSRNSMLSNGVAFLVSNLAAYLINIYWVFVPGRYPWLVEVALFYLVSGVAILIGTWIMGVLIRRFGMMTTYAFGSNLFAALMINYAMRKFFIFNG
jgi:putative flippase GtrA